MELIDRERMTDRFSHPLRRHSPASACSPTPSLTRRTVAPLPLYFRFPIAVTCEGRQMARWGIRPVGELCPLQPIKVNQRPKANDRFRASIADFQTDARTYFARTLLAFT